MLELCPDCQSYPPNIIKERLWSNQRGEFFGVECRDCGDYWEEFPAEDDFFLTIKEPDESEPK